MTFQLHHSTSYRYSQAVFLSPHVFRLKPSIHVPAFIENYEISFDPEPQRMHWLQDVYGNSVVRVIFSDALSFLSVSVSFNAKLPVYDPFNFYLEDYAMYMPFQYTDGMYKVLFAYLETEDAGENLRAFVWRNTLINELLVDFLVRINRTVFESIRYTQREEAGVQRCEETLLLQSGSCRDSAWLLVQVLRQFRIASRFVSGYLLETGEGISDRVSLHAWTEAFLPGAGWLALDPTTGLFAGAGHIALAFSASPPDAAPVSGTIGECTSIMRYYSTVYRL